MGLRVDRQASSLLLKAKPVTETVSASRDLTLQDFGKTLEVDPGAGTVTITLPSGFPQGFFVRLRQTAGAGTVQFAAGSGATANALASVTNGPSTGPYSILEIWGEAVAEVRASDAWLVSGLLA